MCEQSELLGFRVWGLGFISQPCPHSGLKICEQSDLLFGHVGVVDGSSTGVGVAYGLAA